MVSDYYVKIWQESDNNLEQHFSGILPNIFSIELEFRYVSSLLNLETTFETFNKSLTCTREMFLSEAYGPNFVLSLLPNFDESLEFLRIVIVPDILSCAREIDNKSVNVGCKVIKLRMQVLVEVSTDDEVDDQVIDESLNTLNFKPASESSIQALKRFKWGDEDCLLPFKKMRLLEGLSSKKECIICLDDFLDGDEVASMPCEHVYHEGCIVKWLETSHQCPLCRYQMPS